MLDGHACRRARKERILGLGRRSDTKEYFFSKSSLLKKCKNITLGR